MMFKEGPVGFLKNIDFRDSRLRSYALPVKFPFFALGPDKVELADNNRPAIFRVTSDSTADD